MERDTSPHSDEAQQQKAADFSALRALHAHQAAKLPSMSWRHPDTGEAIYLIDDAQLRSDLGPLAGKIASSHHWNIEDLTGKLGNQFNAPPAFPSEWVVDPVKIACLLRCADAAHINQARAPLFLYALLKRTGVSQQHWTAQHRMMGPSLALGDSPDRAIMYTTTRPFKESEALAWWVAHDAVVVVDREIRQSNSLLRSRARPNTAPEFQAKRVIGADSIEELIHQLPVDGWTPCSAQPHVSNVESLVKELGGEKLYGEGNGSFQVVLRELLQNARDAVVARRFIESDFDGTIAVRLARDGNATYLSIEDNGIGMSNQVMTGPLLDFGQSFWRSSLIQSEFPGLRSSSFRSIGRFGIGFYSVFMIADRVEVASKRWDKGLDDANTLVFESGVTMRPILRTGRSASLTPQNSTKVDLRLKDGWIDAHGNLSIKPALMGVKDFSTPLRDYIAALAIGLDVRIMVDVGQGKQEAHGGTPGVSPDATEILRRISFSAHQRTLEIEQTIARMHSRLRPIKSDNRIYGVAAISTDYNSSHLMLGMPTVGGLTTSLEGRSEGAYVGYIDHKPRSARRDATEIDAPDELVAAWAHEQLLLLNESPLNDLERCIAGLHLLQFGRDPTYLGRLLVSVNQGDRIFVTYAQLASLAQAMPIAFLKMDEIDHMETHHSVQGIPGMVQFFPVIGCRALGLKMLNGQPEVDTVAGCLHRAIVASGRIAKWEVRQTAFRSTFGQPLQAVTVSSGSSTD